MAGWDGQGTIAHRPIAPAIRWAAGAHRWIQPNRNSRISETTAEMSSELRQPMRLEKKKNIRLE